MYVEFKHFEMTREKLLGPILVSILEPLDRVGLVTTNRDPLCSCNRLLTSVNEDNMFHQSR